ncbi:LOW QUALITY PROTEIN: acid sphingomyelinase-like phosphodiesterase 3b [Babylonia areolata]|uniref:LOW QUALITY PROTEIN: acid sphingomyelinase-like phosphodiesterase 3b n=1 Tax=Babylonia areolata TaxID=304850 RepID=UPI003FD54832
MDVFSAFLGHHSPRCVLLLLMVLSSGSYTASAVPRASNIGKFWHVTDFHYDHTYWTSQLSCNANVSDPGALGDYWCDSPWSLVFKAVQAMVTHYQDVDFLIWTGDTVAHISDDHLSVDQNLDILQNITRLLQTAFPDKTVYASYGNHDYYPANQFPDLDVDSLDSLIYNRTAEMWKDWIGDSAQLDTFRLGGYYTGLVSPKLRVVCLNTNLYYTSNKQTPGTQDPSDQMRWLRGVLQGARNASQKVIITAHIPPGVHTPTRVVWYQMEFQTPIISMLQDFTDVIVAMHFGHDHHDGFKVFYDKQGRAAVPLFVAPSVTPWRYKLKNGITGPAHNPSLRLVTYDRDTGRHLDIQQLWLDLPNSPRNDTFQQLYTFTQHYKVPDISAQSLDQLVTRMGSDEEGTKLLQDYYKFSVAGADQEGKTCDKKCQGTFLCGFKHYELTSFDKCVEDYTTSSSPRLLMWPLSSAAAAVVVHLLMMVAVVNPV